MTLGAGSYKVMENDKYLSRLWQRPLIFPHCHQAFPAGLSGGKHEQILYKDKSWFGQLSASAFAAFLGGEARGGGARHPR